jgi:hypothetical protein
MASSCTAGRVECLADENHLGALRLFLGLDDDILARKVSDFF